MGKNARRWVAAVVALGVTALPAAVAPVAQAASATDASVVLTSGWVVTDLGVLPGELHSAAADINDAGLAVGISGRGPGHAVSFGNGAVQRLDTDVESNANAINNGGRIVGDVRRSDGYHAAEFLNGSATSLGAGHARDINDAGVVVGHTTVGDIRRHALRFLPTFKDLHPGESLVTQANVVGQGGGVFGIQHDGAGVFRGVRFNDGGPTTSILTSGPTNLAPAGINDFGVIAANGIAISPNPNPTRALITNGVAEFLDPLSGGVPWSLADVNNAGIAIGNVDTIVGDVIRREGVLYRDGVATRVTDWYPQGYQWELTFSAINDHDQIVGWATIRDEEHTTHAIRLDPPPHPCGDEFHDVDELNPFCSDISWLTDEGIATGFDDGNYRPLVPVTRQAMAAFLWRYGGSPAVGSTPRFADVPPSHPFFAAIQWMHDSGLSTGTAQGGGQRPLFKPTDAVSRQAMAAFLWRFIGSPTTFGGPSFADVTGTSAFFAAIQWMQHAGISTGTPEAGGQKPLYKPVAAVSRQAMAAFLHRFDDIASL